MTPGVDARRHNHEPALQMVTLIVVALAMCVISACSRSPNPTTQPAATPITRTVERGPVKLTVSVPNNEVTVGDRIPLTIDVTAEPGVAVIMPQIKETLGKFEVGNPQTPPDIPEGARRRWTHSYDLRILESGDAEVPAIAVKFADQRQANAGESTPVDGEVTTEPFTISVKTLMTGEFDPTNFRDIKGAVEVPVSHARRWWWAAIIAAAAIALAVVTWLIFRLRRARPVVAPPPLPAHLWAMRELDRLAGDNLIARGEFHAFFFRLSMITRQYIERRFAISAAEQTTDEFLREARNHPVLNDDQRSLLSRFLRLADMVKFARFQPQPGESEEVFAAARNFVQQTAPRGDAPESPTTPSRSLSTTLAGGAS